MPEMVGLPTDLGQAADRNKFNIQPIKGFDYSIARHWLFPNSNKASLNIPLKLLLKSQPQPSNGDTLV